MPTYAYRCRDCGNTLEVHQGFADAALTECPVCGGVLRKQYGTVGVTFNGSGFYRTDSRAGEGGAKKDGAGKDGAAKDGAANGGGDSASKGSAAKESGAKSDGAKKDSAPAKAAAAKPATSSAG